MRCHYLTSDQYRFLRETALYCMEVSTAACYQGNVHVYLLDDYLTYLSGGVHTPGVIVHKRFGIGTCYSAACSSSLQLQLMRVEQRLKAGV